MITQAEVLTKLTEFQTYSETQAPANKTYFDTIISTFKTTINSYFSRDNSKLNTIMKELAFWLYCDIQRRTTKHEYEFNENLPTDYPVGYDNIEKCFYQFAELLSISDESFYAGWILAVPDPDTAGTGIAVPQSNTYLTKWTTEITDALTGDFEKVQNLSDWCQNACGNSDLISLFEEQGNTTERLTIKQIADQIYCTKKLLNVINSLSLSVYVPSYIKNQ